MQSKNNNKCNKKNKKIIDQIKNNKIIKTLLLEVNTHVQRPYFIVFLLIGEIQKQIKILLLAIIYMLLRNNKFFVCVYTKIWNIKYDHNVFVISMDFLQFFVTLLNFYCVFLLNSNLHLHRNYNLYLYFSFETKYDSQIEIAPVIVRS